MGPKNCDATSSSSSATSSSTATSSGCDCSCRSEHYPIQECKAGIACSNGWMCASDKVNDEACCEAAVNNAVNNAVDNAGNNAGNQCICNAGTPATGGLCPSNGAMACVSCNAGYTLPDGVGKCVADEPADASDAWRSAMSAGVALAVNVACGLV